MSDGRIMLVDRLLRVVGLVTLVPAGAALAFFSLIAFGGGMGDCFDPPCWPPTPLRLLYFLLIFGSLAVPFIGMYALLGDHPRARRWLLAIGIVQLVGAAFGYPYIHDRMGVPAVFVIGVALYAAWRRRLLSTA